MVEEGTNQEEDRTIPYHSSHAYTYLHAFVAIGKKLIQELGYE